MNQSLRLFDQFVRSEHRPASNSETSYEFWNRSAWPACENIRGVLERWFASYPASHQVDLHARFRERDQNHAAALFELYLHQVLMRLGLSPEVHPEPGSGKGRPDFAVAGAGGSRCYLEANVVSKSRLFSDDPLENELLDAINTVAETRPTRIGVAVSTKGMLERSHKRAPIQQEVRAWLDRIDPEVLSATAPHRNPCLRIQRDGWEVELVAFGPLSLPTRRLIRMGPTKTGWLDEGSQLAKSLKSKAKRYGKLDRPLILAINTNDVSTSGQDEYEALLGTRHGIWCNDSPTRHQRVHGVLFFRGLFPSNMHSVDSRLYVNPNIQADIPEELLTLSNMWQRNGKWQVKQGLSLGAVLELPDDWPGEVTASNWHNPSQ